MARFVKAKCPECGARLRIDAEAEEMTCEYCGTVARIENKKNASLPPVQTPGMVIQPVVRVSTGANYVWIIFIIIPVLMALGIGSTAFIGAFSRAGQNGAGNGPGSGGAAGQSFGEHMQWIGHKQPMLFDVNQDGIADPVGWVRFLNSGKALDHVGAFDALTGARLWLTDPIVDSSQQHVVRAAISGDKLLVADATGVLRAYSLYNGQVYWNGMLGERAKRICGAAAGFVRVETMDERSLNVTLANGQVSPAGKADGDTPCVGVVTTEPVEGLYSRLGGGTWDEGGILNPEIEGMSVSKVLVDKVGGAHVALGRKYPGTGVPTVALYNAALVTKNKRKVTPIWMAGVSAFNPLTIAEDDVEVGALVSGRLIVPYGMQDSEAPGRLACLDLASGRSLWDVPVPRTDSDDVDAIVSSDRQIFVAHWTYLDIFDLATGAHRLTIGVW